MLPENFLFSQTSLQDFIDCRRRFYLRYVRQIKWPAVQTEPVLEHEKFIAEGSALHEAIHQYLIGIPEEKINSIRIGSRFEAWWENFQNLTKSSPAFTEMNVLRLAEHTLMGAVEGYRLIAKYDMLAAFPDGKVTIFDWKTSNKKPKRTWLLSRMQSVIYPFLLLESGQHLQPNRIEPENVTMVYWFASNPDQQEIINYNQQTFRQDTKIITDLIQLIDRLLKEPSLEESFPLTEDLQKCAFCTFRSLCNTGVQAGHLDNMEDSIPDEIEFDFDQISEVSF